MGLDKSKANHFHNNHIPVPSDWNVLSIAEIATKEKGAIKIGPFGSQLRKDEFIENGIKVYDQETAFLNDFFSGRNFISEKKFQSLKSCELKPGDLIISMMGTIGASAIVPENAPRGILNSHLLRVRPDKSLVYDEFLKISISDSPFTGKQIKRKSHGGIMSGLSAEIVKSIQLLLPPLPEQKAIARVLSTADAAIHSTEKLIAQKELRKKWLMQQLLTGKKRLKGFGGEWKKLGAGEVFKSITKKGFSDEELLSATQDKGMIPRTMLEGRVTMPTTGTEGFKLVEIGDFVISLRSFQGGLEYSYYRGLVSPAYTVLKPKKTINEEFYKQYFKSYDFIGHLAIAVIGIRDGKQISYDDFCTVKIPYPTYEEQTAIAQVLQAADKEISLLKQKAEKLREQKKGLMQVLLTGRVRLKINN